MKMFSVNAFGQCVAVAFRTKLKSIAVSNFSQKIDVENILGKILPAITYIQAVTTQPCHLFPLFPPKI